MLSKRAQAKLLDSGSEGERVVHARLKGPVKNVFFITTYFPHRARVAPCQDDTLQDLETVLHRVPQGDCICMLGDFNEQLEGGIQNRTGKWARGNG